MAQLAIKGHSTRGNEVIKILEMLGGVNFNNHDGCRNMLYVISTNECEIMVDFMENYPSYNIYNLETFLEQFPYKTGDSVIVERKKCFITDVIWHDELNCIRYKVFHTTGSLINGWYYVCNLQPYKEITMEKEISGAIVDRFICLEGYDFYDDKGNILNTKEVIMKKKQPQYPKNYEECCEVLMGKTDFQDFSLVLTKLSLRRDEENRNSPAPPYISSINTLYKLLISRDAYWKIAGEQLGLGKHWRPDWGSANSKKSILYTCENKIHKGISLINNHILAFPTEEMRNAFCENFKELIEECKELL